MPTASQVVDLLGCLGREGDKSPAVGTPSLPNPKLGIEDNDHDLSITHQATAVGRSRSRSR
jgi:hypothetical protein